jgi:hypothetical protein
MNFRFAGYEMAGLILKKEISPVFCFGVFTKLFRGRRAENGVFINRLPLLSYYFGMASF